MFGMIIKKIKMKKIYQYFPSFFLFSFSIFINAQTVDEIIQNYIENSGGIENWEKVKSVKMNMTISQMGMEIPIEQYLSSRRRYSKISIQGQEIKQSVFDGKILWSTNFMSMKAEKSDEENLKIVKDVLAEFPDHFLNYKKNGFNAELVGTEVVDGSDAFKVKLTKKPILVDGQELPNISIYYFDSESFFPIMIHEEYMSGPAKGMIMEARMGEYKDVEGLYMPFSMSQGVKDQPGQPIDIISIELNVEADDSEFKFPKTVAEQQNK